MFNKKIDKPKKLNDFIILKDFVNKMNFEKKLLILPTILSFLAVIFDGCSKGLLIPLMKGFITRDFNFIRESVVFKEASLVIFQWFTTIPTIFIFIFFAGLVFICELTAQALSYYASLTMAYNTRLLGNKMRKNVFNSYLGFGKLYFDRSGFGHLNNFLMTETDFVVNNIVTLQRTIIELFRLVLYALILSLISWKLTFFVICCFPILFYSTNWIIEKIRKTSMNLGVALDSLNKKAFNVLSNIALVKFYTSEKYEKEIFHKISDERAILEFGMDKKQLVMGPLQAIFGLTALLLLSSAVGFIGGKDDVAKFLVYIYLLRSCVNSFSNVNFLRICLGGISWHIEQLSSVFDNNDKCFVVEGTQEFPGLKKVIEFKNLNFSYENDKYALKNVTFPIVKGEMTALVGPSGSGKTTLINILMRFYDCSPQSIFIDGSDIRNFTLKSLRTHMAFVSQDTLLFNDTLKNNIMYGLDIVREEKIFEALKKAKLYDFVMELPRGLDTLIGDKGIQLSGGERQRVSIARALLKNTEILILDEATASLDTSTEKLIQGAIEEAVKERTTIVIAHRLSTIKNSDKIIVLEKGAVAEMGTIGELLAKKGKFYSYWEEQKFY